MDIINPFLWGEDNLNLEKRIVDEIIDIARKYRDINKVVLFGSRARGDNSPKSNIDLAIYADNSSIEHM